jgi:hypothetical protein
VSSSRFVATGFGDRWRAAVSELFVPATVLATAWTLYWVPGAIAEGARGYVLALQAAQGPLIASALLTAFLAVVRAGQVRGRARTVAVAAAGIAAGALTTTIAISFMSVSGLWSPNWPWPVVWWFNLGQNVMICVGAAFIEDYRVQGLARNAALRDIRLREADVVRRTAEVRLQAARARVEPRFLFDALSAVERAYDVNAAAGNRLLDDLVTYLRAVVPDLRETPSDAERDTEIARLRRAIQCAIDNEEPESHHR